MLIFRRLQGFSAILCCWLSASSVSVISVPAVSLASSLYTYTDDAGILILTSELDAIPQKYRSQLTRHEFVQPVDPPLSAQTDLPLPSAPAQAVTAAGEHRMGDYDTRTDAIRLAVEAAKKDALEQVATYLESVTEVRDLDVTRDDIRSYTAGIVKVLEQTITTRVEEDTVVVRADLTAEVAPQTVVRAIAALRENESASRQLQALRAETDQLQRQLDQANAALAAALSPDDVQTLVVQREDLLAQLQAKAQASHAWSSVVSVMPGLYSLSGISAPGVNRPWHRGKGLPRGKGLGVAPSPQPVAPGPVGSFVPPPLPRGIHSPQTTAPGPPYQLHPSHFWRPSPPNIHGGPAVPQQHRSMGTGQTGTRTGSFGGGGRFGGGQGGRGR